MDGGPVLIFLIATQGQIGSFSGQKVPTRESQSHERILGLGAIFLTVETLDTRGKGRGYGGFRVCEQN